MPTLPVIILLHFKPCFFLDILPLPSCLPCFSLPLPYLPLSFSWLPILPPSFPICFFSLSTLPPHPMHLPQSELDISAVSGGSGKWFAFSLTCPRQELALLCYCSCRYVVWINLESRARGSLHRVHSMSSLTGGHQLKNSATKEQWIIVKGKLEVKDAEMLQLSNKPKYLQLWIAGWLIVQGREKPTIACH